MHIIIDEHCQTAATILAKKSSHFYTVKLCKNVNFFLASTVCGLLYILIQCIFAELADLLLNVILSQNFTEAMIE